MNKKYGIILVFVFLVGAVFLSACQSEVGAKINRNVANQRAVDVGGGEKELGTPIKCQCSSTTETECVGSLELHGDGWIYADCSCCETTSNAN